MSKKRYSLRDESIANRNWKFQIQTVEHYGHMQNWSQMPLYSGPCDEYLKEHKVFPHLRRATVKLTGAEAAAQHEKRMAYEKKLLTARNELYRVVTDNDETPNPTQDEDKATARAIAKHAHKTAQERRARELGQERTTRSGQAA